MNTIKVTVIILTYNNLNYLENALKSVYMQEYENIEVIIADDCSLDFDIEKVKKLINICGATRDTKIISSDVNKGTVINFNNAIRQSTGELIFPLACDDKFFDTKTVGNIVDFFEMYNVQVCTSKRVGELTRKIFPNNEDVEILKNQQEKNLLLDRLSVDNFLSGSTLYYKKKYLESVGLFDEKYKLLEDYPFVYKMALKAERIGWMDRITIEYGEKGISSPQKWGTNSILTKDFDILFNEEIKPNIERITLPIVRRYIRYIDGRKEANVFSRIANAIIYFDILFVKIVYKLSKKKKSIFWYLNRKKEKRCK